MENISRSLLTFLLNSLWQIPLAAAVAALVCRVMRNGPASHRHAVWVAALLAAIVLPLASVHTGEPMAAPQFAPPDLTQAIANAKASRSPAQPASNGQPSASSSRTVTLGGTTVTVLTGAYFLFVLFRLGRLAWAAIRTMQIRRHALVGAMPPLLEHVWTRCQQDFGLPSVALIASDHVSGPVAAGRAIILPDSLLFETSEDVLTTAIGHEMAHISRHDFGFNFLYELLYLPIGFHPAAWLIHRNIERTREMACDELVTHRLLDAGVYARSILSIASGMTALPRPGYTLGVFDGDILEERIRRLMERPLANRLADLRRARLLLAAGLSALAICAVIASSLALTARAQSGANTAMKEGEAAYNRGDFKAAAQQFANAVTTDPANIDARLSLANALMREGDPTSVAGAQQQYLEVIARDPANKRASQGLMMTYAYSKDFAAAHQWALKAIQADPQDAAAYYTAGFADWSIVYPDYMRTRTAAGMNPQDPGIIPDTAARKALRDRHQAHIEDGFRMLQVALQINPNYADAMAYMNLLYRIQAAIVDTPAESNNLIAKSDDWVEKALAAKRHRSPNAPPASAGSWLQAPPPPPPPPPPGVPNNLMASAVPPPRPRNAAELPNPFWQVAGPTDMTANALVSALNAKGFPNRLFLGPDNLARVIVGPYPQQSLAQARSALEAAGFHALSVW